MFYLAHLKKDSIMSEIFSLACSVYRTIQQSSRVLIADTRLFDMNMATEALKKYKVHLFESGVEYELVAFFYGKGNKIMDLTDKVPSVIPVQYELNLLEGDPSPGIPKEIFMSCTINGVEFNQTYQEGRSSIIHTDLKGLKPHTDFFWIDKVRLELFYSILKSFSWKEKSLCPKDAHVLHVLSPEDVEEYRKKEGHSIEVYYAKLLDKYKEIIKKHIPINEPLLLLEKGNSLEDFLNTNGYTYTSLNIQDASSFSTAIQATGTFIGNFHLETLTGSSTSYYLHTVSKCRQSILIDLDNLFD